MEMFSEITNTIIVSGKVTDIGGVNASRVSAQNTAYKRSESHVHGMLLRLCSLFEVQAPRVIQLAKRSKAKSNDIVSSILIQFQSRCITFAINDLDNFSVNF